MNVLLMKLENLTLHLFWKHNNFEGLVRDSSNSNLTLYDSFLLSTSLITNESGPYVVAPLGQTPTSGRKNQKRWMTTISALD